jgi:hypothetical protein
LGHGFLNRPARFVEKGGESFRNFLVDMPMIAWTDSLTEDLVTKR